MGSLDKLISDLTLFKKGQLQDADTLLQMEEIKRKKKIREELRRQNDIIALRAFQDLDKLKALFS